MFFRIARSTCEFLLCTRTHSEIRSMHFCDDSPRRLSQCANRNQSNFSEFSFTFSCSIYLFSPSPNLSSFIIKWNAPYGLVRRRTSRHNLRAIIICSIKNIPRIWFNRWMFYLTLNFHVDNATFEQLFHLTFSFFLTSVCCQCTAEKHLWSIFHNIRGKSESCSRLKQLAGCFKYFESGRIDRERAYC